MLTLLLIELTRALWIFLPAGVANVFPPLSKFIKNKHPMDFNLKIGGQRIFGNGKTWEGFSIGMIFGIIVGLIEYFSYSFLNPYSGGILPELSLLIILLIPLGALLGDVCGSLIKRRMKMKRGAEAPLLDQLDFIIGSIIFTYFFIDYSLLMIALMLILTFVSHRIASIIGYKLKVKREPW